MCTPDDILSVPELRQAQPRVREDKGWKFGYGDTEHKVFRHLVASSEFFCIQKKPLSGEIIVNTNKRIKWKCTDNQNV